VATLVSFQEEGGLYGEVPPEKGAFSALAVYVKAGRFAVVVFKRVAEIHTATKQNIRKLGDFERLKPRIELLFLACF